MASHTAPGSIVVGVDGSPGSDQALDWAADQAALEHRPLALVLSAGSVAFAGSGDYLGASQDYAAIVAQSHHEDVLVLEQATARAQARHGTLEISRVLSEADPRNALLELGRHAAMLVLGSRGRGPVASLLLGSVSAAVSRHATCPVVVLRPGVRPGGGVMVGVDGTARSIPAVEFAYAAAAARGCTLTVVHCWDAPVLGGRGAGPAAGAEHALTAESLAGMSEKYPDVPVEVRLLPGRGAPELLASSDGYALLVVGYQRDPLHGLFHDATATTLLEHARCPVAVVPAR